MNIFEKDINKISDELEVVERVHLIDTCLLSRLENVYYHHGDNIINCFVNNEPIIITSAIKNELQLSNTSARYQPFLANFPRRFLIEEQDFFQYLLGLYIQPKAISLFQRHSAEAFSTIQYFSECIRKINTDIPNNIHAKYQKVFSSGKNKGEYSLIWLAKILKLRFPQISINIIGCENDLYEIYYNTYIRNKPLVGRDSSLKNVNIYSLDTMLQGLWLSKQCCEKCLIKYCKHYRDDKKKLYYKRMKDGITSHELTLGSLDNSIFTKGIVDNELRVIF